MSESSQGIRPVGEETVHAISRIRNESGELETGNVVRRACEAVGEQACRQVCLLRNEYSDVMDAVSTRACADVNLQEELRNLGLSTHEVLMVGVTGDEVGFADKLDEYEKLTQNPYGWRELPGFNAFFARKGEVSALGRRLADCADINFEFTDQDGNTVFGFEHGTRPNMRGSTQYKFEKDGRPMSYTEYVLREAVEHYGADPASVHIKLAAAIKGHNFTKRFSSREKMEEHLPGWFADGFVANVSNPHWQEGDPIIESDIWHADTRAMISRDITEAMQALGVSADNLSMEGIIDPGDSKGIHSSHQFKDKYGDTRDLYITFLKPQ